MSIPLSALDGLSERGAADRLRTEFGGKREVDKDGAVYMSIGSRPVPPPKALRKIHAHRQDERRQRDEELEAEAYEKEHGMVVASSSTAPYFQEDLGAEATKHKRQLAQRSLEAQLSDTAFGYQLSGCGLAECDGFYKYSESSSHGAPVYKHSAGWILHRDRPPEVASIGSEEGERTAYGWLVSKDGKPVYAVRTEDLVVPEKGWQCFYGPPPPPSRAVPRSWDDHLVETCGGLKDQGNAALRAAHAAEAERRYSEALGVLDGYEAVVEASQHLRQLLLALLANRAEARLRCSQWQQAMDDCREVLSRVPRHAKAAVRLAKACRALGCSSDALAPLRQALGGDAAEPEVLAALEEAEVLAACELGTSPLRPLFDAAQALRDALEGVRLKKRARRRAQRRVEKEQQSGLPRAEQPETTRATAVDEDDDDEGGEGDNDCDEKTTSQEASDIAGAAEAVCAEMGRTLASDRQDKELASLTRGLGLFDKALASACSQCCPSWAVKLMAQLVGGSGLLQEAELRRVLRALPAMAASGLALQPQALSLARSLLRRESLRLRVADSIVEAKGLLPNLLRHWVKLLDCGNSEASFEEGQDGAIESAEAAAEVLQALDAQVTQLDNVEALALALFVECFVGERREDGAATGGVAMYSSAAARKVVLALLRRWSEDKRILQSLAPGLIARLWPTLRAKLRRDAGVETHKEVSAGSGKQVVRLEWFKLKPSSYLRRGGFHPEELLEAALPFLTKHLQAHCESKGSTSKAPGAAEWMDEVLDQPFGWGVLLPLIVAVPTIASRALALLEALVLLHPDDARLARRFAGLHVFMPLLALPWPVGRDQQSASSHLGATLRLGSSVRRSSVVLLRCAVDTEMAMRVVEDHLDVCLNAAVDLLLGTFEDQEHQPSSIVAACEVVGIICNNLRCVGRLSEDAVFRVLEVFVRSSHKPSRAQLAKLLRLVHSDEESRVKLNSAFADKRLQLQEDHCERLMKEIFDIRTLAGQAAAEQLQRQREEEERCPLQDGIQATALAKSIAEVFFTNRTKPPRVLLLGRAARPLCRYLAALRMSSKFVLGDTTLDKFEGEHLGQNVLIKLLPTVQAVNSDAMLASEELFDLVISVEPLGYLDIAEYAQQLRPFIRRRQKEDDKVNDQIQWLCAELKERAEDARDELFSAGYYNIEHFQGLSTLKRAASTAGWDVSLLSLPSYEKEQHKKSEQQKAQERKANREREEVTEAMQADEDDRRRNILYRSLFSAQQSPLEALPLPLAFEIGASRAEADLVLVWLHGNLEEPSLWRLPLEGLVTLMSPTRKLRVIVPTFPSGHDRWFSWSDQDAVNHGMEWYEVSDAPTDEARTKAAKDPAINVNFGRPTLEELQSVAEVEVCCKQLLALLHNEASSGLSKSCKVILGGFSQGASVAVYSCFSGTAAPEVQDRIHAVIVCCSGVPVFHFLASKMQARVLSARVAVDELQSEKLCMVYGTGDAEVNDNYVQTSRDLCRRFGHEVSLLRFPVTAEERFPTNVRQQVLRDALESSSN